MRGKLLVAGRIFFFQLLSAILRFFNEGVGVKLACKIFNCRDDARGGPVHGIADHGVTAIAHSIQDAPPGKCCQHFDSGRRRLGMRCGENEKLRLQAGDFFKADLRPALLGVHDGNRTCPVQRVGNGTY